MFVVLQEGLLRSVRKGWVATWDDDERVALIEFGAAAVRVAPGGSVDEEPFELYEDQRRVQRKTHGRPNQQRFKIQVVQRYGGACAVCPMSAMELLNAAHLVPDSEHGTSDPRNGLPLCGNHHAALDRHLIAVEPGSGRIVVAKGHSAASLNITRPDLAHLPAQPAAAALQFRWDRRVGNDWRPVA